MSKKILAIAGALAVGGSLMVFESVQASGFGDFMNPGKWFGNKDRDDYYRYGYPGWGGYGGPYGYPGYGYGYPGWGGYGYPGYGYPGYGYPNNSGSSNNTPAPPPAPQ